MPTPSRSQPIDEQPHKWLMTDNESANLAPHSSSIDPDSEDRIVSLKEKLSGSKGKNLVATQTRPPMTVSPDVCVDTEYGSFFDNRMLPSCTSSFLRPGSTFVGSQQSGRHTYEVNVDIKQVDMANAFICGYLRIEGLTEDHPTLITYFEGEMISTKYSFFTKREEWGATEKTDIAHW